MLFWTLVGIAIGYFFKPQLDSGLKKVVRMLKERNNGDDGSYY
jgi:hypothetical protein